MGYYSPPMEDGLSRSTRDRVRSGSALIAAQLLAIGGGFDLVLSRQNHPLMPVVGARKRAGASRRWLLTPESDRPPTLPREASHW